MQASFLSILSDLVETPSVIGSEYPFLKKIQQYLSALHLDTCFHEGLLEVKGDPDYKGPILSAHVDRHGLLCTGPNEFQYAAFTSRFKGDLDGGSLSEQMLTRIASRFLNQTVIAYHPWEGTPLQTGIIESSFLCPIRNNLIFTLASDAPMDAGIPLGYKDHLSIQDGFISAQLDNVLSVAILLTLYKHGFRGRSLFTCEEEAGRSWRYLLAYFQRQNEVTQDLIVLDTSPFETKEEATQFHIVLRNSDISASFNSLMTQRLADFCQDQGIPFCKKDTYIAQKNRLRFQEGKDPISIGQTELGRLIHGGLGRVSGTTLQVPTFGYHTNAETFQLAALPAVFFLLQALTSGDRF